MKGGAVNMGGINHQFKRKQSPPPYSAPQGRESQRCVCLSFLSSSALLVDNSIPVQGGDPSLYLPGLETKLRLYLELILSDARISIALLLCIGSSKALNDVTIHDR